MTENRLTLDTDKHVFFYEQDHYYLSNFSAFRLFYAARDFDTSEQAYQWCKFRNLDGFHVSDEILRARSAHDAFKIAERNKALVSTNWPECRVKTMRDILRAKAQQHEYVRRKLLETGDKELIEHSWRDDFWGWGPNRDGQNMLGKLWMKIRTELRQSTEV